MVERLTEYERAIREAGIPLEESWRGAPEYNPFALLVEASRAGNIKEIERFNKIDRKEFISVYGFAILTHEALTLIAHHSPLIEVGSGTGYLAWELGRVGADVVATDANPPTEDGKGQFGFRRQWVEVLPLSECEAVDTYPERTLLMSWPSHNEGWAAEVLGKYRGKQFVYIGEYRACCADDAFFNLLESQWEQVAGMMLPVWYGMHDSLVIFNRRTIDDRVEQSNSC